MSDINKSYEGQTAETQEELNARMEVLIQQSSAMLQAMQNTQQLAQAAEEQEEDDAVSVDLMELLFYILGKIKYVLLAAVAGALLALCYVLFLSTPEYQATAKLYIIRNESVVDMTALNIGSALTMDYQEVFNIWEVHGLVREKLQLDHAEYPISQMQKMVSVTNPDDTRFLYISVKHEDPQMAMDLVNAYVDEAAEYIKNKMGTDKPSDISEARLPSTPIGLGTQGYIILGFLAGTGLSLLVLVMLFLLDDRPHTPNDITKMAGIPTLAVVPREEAARKNSRSRNRKGKHSKRSHSHTHSSGSSRSAK